jgi:hypothetical protein
MLRIANLTALAAAFAFSRLAPAADLEEPLPVVVASGILDVEHAGCAAPLAVDFDGDGKKDLLVGEQVRVGNEIIGRVRLYRNQGQNEDPRFEQFRYFADDAASRYVPIASNRVFVPQFVDLDGDGLRDFVTGTSSYEISLIRGQEGGKFAAPEPLKDRNGKTLAGVYAYAVSAADWDGDGDLDLVVGGVADGPPAGEVFLFRNDGTAKQYDFAKPEPLKTDDRLIEATEGNASPCVADWNRDGKLDLFLGCGDGSVRWYRNTGTRQAPVLAKSELLVPAPGAMADRGKLARPCVVDWNEDGQLDLLVGDTGKPFDKVLSAEEDAWRKEAQQKQAETFTAWAAVFARYRQLAADARDPSSAELFRGELAELRGKLVELNAVRERYFQQEQFLQPGRQTHGRVWLFLGAP